MYWLHPPPVLRRIAAVALVLGAIAWDLRGTPIAPFPIAAAPIAAGTNIEGLHVEWIDLPADALPATDPIGSTAAVSIAAGEPLTRAVLAGPVTAPAGWWTLPLAVGTLAAPGDEVMLVVVDPPLSVIGRVVEPQVGDPFDLDHRPAAVAVPPESAAVIAAAAQHDLLVTAIRPTAAGR